MAGQAPKSTFARFECKGVLSEYVTPSEVGGRGLTACNNLIYHRQASWGKRPGAQRTALPGGPHNSDPVSGFRWYRAYPTPLTKLITYSQGTLSAGNDPLSLTPIGNFAPSGAMAPTFCSARDPQARQGQGADVLIVAGLTITDGSFGTGNCTITGIPGPQPTGVYLTLTVALGANTVTTTKYYVLGTDNPASIAANLVTLLNETAAFLNQGSFAPFIGEAYSVEMDPPYGALDSGGAIQSGAAQPSAVIYLGAAEGGSAGNSISYSITISSGSGGNGSLLVNAAGQSPVSNSTSTANFTGGGQSFSGLAKYDPSAGILAGLSYMAPNAFTGVTTWHSHVWAWGDPQNPDTVFACDINQPEAWTFMVENGGMTATAANGGVTGGYEIGRGDGDANVQACIPTGNGLYVFKTSNIYMIEGYDFQSGEYQFSVTPQVQGYGIPSQECVAVLENEVVFWSGRKFMRLAVGAYEPEHIGYTIPLTEGLASKGQQALVKCIAGDFQVQTLLNNSYGIPQPFTDSTVIYRSLAMWAMDFGDGKPDTIVVYDDEQTNAVGQYAWSVWSGWDIGCWIQYGNGPNSAGTDTDKPIAYFIDPKGQYIHLVGGHATDDWGNPIPWLAQTGWIDYGSAEVLKNAHRLFLNAESTNGANFTSTIVPGRIIPGQPNQVLPYGTAPVTVTFQPTIAPTTSEALNCLDQYYEPAVQSNSVLMQFEEDGTSLAGFEMLSFGLDANPAEAWAP